MKEVTFRIPDHATELVTELVEKLGGEVQEVKAQKKVNAKKSDLKKLSPLDYFGKYPDFPLDPETFREQLWGRKVSL